MQGKRLGPYRVLDLCDERGENSTFSRIEVVGDPDSTVLQIRSTGRSTTLSWKK